MADMRSPHERFIWNVEERFLSVDDLIRRVGRAVGAAPDRTAQVIEKRRLLSHPLRRQRRRRLALTLADSPFANLISPTLGFGRLGRDFPGLPAAVAAGQTVLAAWEQSKPDLSKWVRYDSRGRANPLIDILTESDLRDFPALLNLGLSREMVGAVATHMGQVPRLLQVGVRVTLAQTGPDASLPPEGSRAFHLDGGPAGVNRVKCFVNLDEVGHDNGPFTFLSMESTWRIAADLGARWWKEPGPSDQEVLARARPDELFELTGPAGTAILINSGRCLHFGGRARVGRRAILQLDYTAMPDGRPRFNTLARPGSGVSDLSRFKRPGDDPVRRLLLDQRGW